MATFISTSPESTFALGAEWGRAAQPGWVFGLTGDLGAGKTELVKGLAHGLGIRDPVRSPTFALVHEYHGGRLPLAHLDFYRLDTAAQILGAGLETFLDPTTGITVVEWCERWPEFTPHAARRLPGRRCRLVRFTPTNDQERHITYEDFGD